MRVPPVVWIGRGSCSARCRRRRGSGRARSAPRGPGSSSSRRSWPRKGPRPSRRTPRSRTTWRCSRSSRGTSPGRRRSCARRARTSPRSLSCPRIWVTSRTARRATTRPGTPTGARWSWRPIWATTCTSSSATSPTSETTVSSRPSCGAGARDQPEARARQGQSGHAERVVVTAGQDERAFRALTQKITRARGLACDSYKDRCLRRRIGVRMRARGVHTFDDYSRVLDQDQREYDLLLDALTINVTKFFRNVETWRALAPWLDKLWVARRGEVRVWSAGCASGEEPYTIAVALAETARRLDQEGRLGRARVDATDVDRVSLERTRAAAFPESAFSETPAELVRRYLTAQAPRRPGPALQRLVRVLKHDLTREPPPAPPYDLIVCRNVVIYFDRPMQARLFLAFAEGLAPGGVLLLGKVETLFGAARERLVLEQPRERIYRRPA